MIGQQPSGFYLHLIDIRIILLEGISTPRGERKLPRTLNIEQAAQLVMITPDSDLTDEGLAQYIVADMENPMFAHVRCADIQVMKSSTMR